MRATMHVMRKPHKTPAFGDIDANPLNSLGLWECGGCVLSGSKTRKRVYLETI